MSSSSWALLWQPRLLCHSIFLASIECSTRIVSEGEVWAINVPAYATITKSDDPNEEMFAVMENFKSRWKGHSAQSAQINRMKVTA